MNLAHNRDDFMLRYYMALDYAAAEGWWGLEGGALRVLGYGEQERGEDSLRGFGYR